MTSTPALDALQESLNRLKAVQQSTSTPVVNPPHTLIGGPENLKLLFDRSMVQTMNGAPLPNAWELLSQRIVGDIVDLARRVSNNVASFDHFVNMNAAGAGQIGTTEGQAQITPIRTGAADTQTQQPAGAVYPPIRNVDQTGATATGVTQAGMAQLAAQVAALSDVVTNLATALGPVLVNASGGASTPSQTEAKPAAATSTTGN